MEGSRFEHRAAAAVLVAGSADYALITPHVWVCCSALTAISKSFAGNFFLLKGAGGVEQKVKWGQRPCEEWK